VRTGDQDSAGAGHQGEETGYYTGGWPAKPLTPRSSAEASGLLTLQILAITTVMAVVCALHAISFRSARLPFRVMQDIPIYSTPTGHLRVAELE